MSLPIYLERLSGVVKIIKVVLLQEVNKNYSVKIRMGYFSIKLGAGSSATFINGRFLKSDRAEISSFSFSLLV